MSVAAPTSTPASIHTTAQVISKGDSSDSISESISALTRGELNDAAAGLVDGLLVPAGMALALLIVAYFLAQAVSRWVTASVCARIDPTLGKFSGKFTYYTILVLASVVIMQIFGIPSASLAAMMAAVGFAIGLAFQGTLSNFASGVLLLVFRPFKVGDVVNAAGVLGKVYEIDLFTTTLDTPDNRRLIIPNGSVAGGAIENLTHHPHRRVDVTIGVAYAASLDDTRAVLTDCVESLSRFMIAGENRGYQIVLTNLGASSVDWTVRFWTATDDYFAVKEALTAEIKQGLDHRGIEIPFTQMQLHVSGPESGAIRNMQASSSETLPIPKLKPLADENRGAKIRPRARGGP